MTVYSVIQTRMGLGVETRCEGVYFARVRKGILLDSRGVRSQTAMDRAMRCASYISFAPCLISKCWRHYELARECAWKSNLERHILWRARSEAHTGAHGHVATSGHKQ